jgi:hypothetical protein
MDKSLQDVFTKEMHSKFDIDLKSIGTNVDLSLNINSPRKCQTHLMGTMTRDYDGMLRLLKWNNLGRFLYYVLRRVHSWCQISAFQVGTIKTLFFQGCSSCNIMSLGWSSNPTFVPAFSV